MRNEYFALFVFTESERWLIHTYSVVVFLVQELNNCPPDMNDSLSYTVNI